MQIIVLFFVVFVPLEIKPANLGDPVNMLIMSYLNMTVIVPALYTGYFLSMKSKYGIL